ncbi:MAG: carbohydrate ABC transporter permease [bacterium]
MKPSRSSQFISYALLLLGAAFFLLPLLWMLSTALKPVEQTMSLPPQWLPRSYSIERDGQRVEIRRSDTLIVVPSLLVRPESGGAAFAVPISEVTIAPSVSASAIWRPAGSSGSGTPVTILKQIPASATSPWVLVYEGKGSLADAMSVDQIIARVHPRWENFAGAVKAMHHFPRYLANTLLLCLLNVLGAVTSSALAAYGFSRIEWRGRERVFLLAMATMMIPFPVVMVPLYSLFRAMGWIGTLQPLWIGSFCAGAFNVFLLRQFFRTIPQDLTEAARIDGCSEFRILWQIILPLCRPALVVVGLFTFLGTWNDFLGPLLYLTDQKDFTLALGLQCYQSQSGGTEWHYLMAASTLVILPVIVLFLLAQRSFIEGISMTGLKG